jgi:hypothetical protein
MPQVTPVRIALQDSAAFCVSMVKTHEEPVRGDRSQRRLAHFGRRKIPCKKGSWSTATAGHAIVVRGGGKENANEQTNQGLGWEKDPCVYTH